MNSCFIIMSSPPQVKEVKDFQFKLHSRLRVFVGSPDSGLFQHNVNILCASSRYGLVFAGHPTGFRVIALSSLQVSGPTEQKEYEHRNVDLPFKPSFISVNADESLLVVVVDGTVGALATIYDLPSLTTQNVVIKYQLRLTETPDVVVRDLHWNPSISSLISFVNSDGSVSLFELKGCSFGFTSLPPTILATCLCWSPKGKQIVIGSSDGKLTQYKPDLKAVRSVEAPPLIHNASVVNVHWLSNFQFCAVYQDAASLDERPCTFIVNTPKNEPIQFTNYDDICFSMGAIRPPQYYMIHQQSWNIILVSSANSMEVGVLAANGKSWISWTQIDEGRAELPADPATKNETYPVGFTLDLSSVQPIPWGSEQQMIAPMPILGILSHTGVLCLFHVVNLNSASATICSPPEPLPNRSALQYSPVFAQPLSASHQTIPAPQQTSRVSPEKPGTPIDELSCFSTTVTAPLSPQPNQLFSSAMPSKPANAPKKLDFSFGHSTLLSTSMTRPLDTSGVSLIPEKSPASSIPAFYLPTSEPAPIIGHLEQDNAENAIALKSVANNAMFSAAVFDEITRFEAELKDLKHLATNLDITVGLEDDKNELKKNVDGLESFHKELTETTNSLNSEVDSLKTVLMEAFSWIEEAKARKMQLYHPGYQSVVRLQELDPVSLQRLNSIQSSCYYVESQLKQTNSQLDSLWIDVQNSLAKDKINMKIPTLENVYQAMVVQKNLVDQFNVKLNGLSSKVKTLQNNRPYIMTSNNIENISGDSELSKLAESLIKVKLNLSGKSGNPCLEAKRHLIFLARRQMLSAIKEVKLKELQSNHTPRRIKPAKLKASNGMLIGSFNALPLPSSEVHTVQQTRKLGSQSILVSNTAPAEPGSVSTSVRPTAINQFSTKIIPPVSKLLQNNTIFEGTQESDSLVRTSSNFVKGSSTFAPKPGSQSSEVQFTFKSSPATNVTTIFTQVVKGGTSTHVTSALQRIPTATMSVVSTDKGKETPKLIPDSPGKIDLTSMLEKNGEPAHPKADPTVTETITSGLNFGSLDPSSTLAASTPAVSGFGDDASKTFNFFGAKVDSSKLEASLHAKSDPLKPNSSLSSSFGLKEGITTPSSSPSSTSVDMTSSTKTSFIFGGLTRPTAKCSAEPSASDAQSFTFALPVPSMPTFTTASTTVFSFGMRPTATATVTTSTMPFSALNLSVTNSTLTSPNQPSLSLSSTCGAPTSGTNAKPEFNFDRASTSGQSSFNTFSFGNMKSQVSLFGGQCKSTETLTTDSTPTSSIMLPFIDTSSANTVNDTTGISGSLTVSSPVQLSHESTPVSTSSVFGSLTTTPTTSSLFGSPTTTASGSLFVSVVTTTTTSLFPQQAGNVFNQPNAIVATTSQQTTNFSQATTVASAADTSSSIFGQESLSKALPPAQSVFGQATSATTSTSQTPGIFGQAQSVTATTTQTSSIFGSGTLITSTSTLMSSVFAQTTSVTSSQQTPSVFPQASSGTSPVQQGPTLFRQSTPVVSSSPQNSIIFGQTTNVAANTPQTSNLFGRPQTTSTSVFGGGTSPAANSTFGQALPISSKSSIFGNTPNLFPTPAMTSPSIFSSPNTATTTTPNTSLFGTPSTAAPTSGSSFFGQAICRPSDSGGNSGNVFGQSGSIFGQTVATGVAGFSNAPLFGGKPTFGQSGGSLFGNSSNSFGSPSGTSVFGSPTNTSAVGNSSATSHVFGQSSASAFGAPPTFGGAPSFGSSAPAFGAPAAFGSPSSVFGSTSPTSTFGGGGGIANQSSPTNATFENLAKQNTVSFGNLAQNQAPSGFSNTNLFGSSPQNSNSFQKQTSPQFGGSSFSSWR
ncbi:uncharacterized protein Nup214 isoform X2 [Bemisia tabaci]|uniref:uncharacterized protein Nup214 isoform X2 n=1 Tax=Bemisia tabaci TaxID=7038 RepID=UPI0008F9BE9E|nr:PREDICTED: nuclear pore complex protein Nup214 isoform X3 [Bemisia tabaci]